MTKQETIITKENEMFGTLRVIVMDEEPWFVGKDITTALGYSNASKALLDHVDEEDKLNNVTLSSLGQRGGWLINESGLYSLILSSKLPSAKQFRKWVTKEVLPSIRKYGAYISNDEDTVNNDYIRFAFGQLKKTFSECPIENLLDTYNECMLWHKVNKTRIPYAKNTKKRKDATHTVNDSKIMIMEKINKVLDDRSIALCSNNKFGLVSEINNVRLQIKDDIKKQNNLSNRGKLGQANAKIKKLQDELEDLPTLKQELELAKMNIDINNYEVIDMHGMSCNYLFKYDSMFGAIKTSTYRKWINDFTRLFEENQLATKEDWEFYYDIDFTKPICIYIKYVAKSEFDIENFNKATIDMLFNRLFGVDDNIVHKVVSERLAVCNTYADGKIMYYIENI